MRQLHTPWHTPMVSFATPSSPMASRGRDVASSQELVGCRRAPGSQQWAGGLRVVVGHSCEVSRAMRRLAAIEVGPATHIATHSALETSLFASSAAECRWQWQAERGKHKRPSKAGPRQLQQGGNQAEYIYCSWLLLTADC